MEKKDLVTLIKRVLSGASTRYDEDQLDTHFNESFHSKEWNENKWGNKKDLEVRIKTKIKAHVSGVGKMGKKSILRKCIPYAAAVLFFLLTGSLIWNTLNNSQLIDMEMIVSEEYLKPGKDRALLELSDGEVVDLESMVVGEVYVKEGISVRKTESGVLEYVYDSNENLKGAETKRNTLRTPLGGKYHIVLADGTRVWMNAGSSLSFPNQFIGKERVVEAVGEMYFEVSHNEEKPFIVRSNGIDVKVLGTAFNLSVYEDKDEHSVALVEGAVELVTKTDSKKLLPGQKGLVYALGMDVVGFDKEAELAWKDNYFVFKNQNIKDIMISLARWYDAEIVYEGIDWENVNFTIRMSRREELKEILSIIELTKSVKFRIEGRRVMISK